MKAVMLALVVPITIVATKSLGGGVIVREDDQCVVYQDFCNTPRCTMDWDGAKSVTTQWNRFHRESSALTLTVYTPLSLRSWTGDVMVVVVSNRSAGIDVNGMGSLWGLKVAATNSTWKRSLWGGAPGKEFEYFEIPGFRDGGHLCPESTIVYRLKGRATNELPTGPTFYQVAFSSCWKCATTSHPEVVCWHERDGGVPHSLMIEGIPIQIRADAGQSLK